jgi:acyl-CoA dehydrogenase
MCRSEIESRPHDAFSLIIVPTNTPGYRIVRETPVLGIHGGHYELELREVRVPRSNLLGERGAGFRIAQQRLGPGRIFHCMRWLGQAQRAFDLMCRRLHGRTAAGSPLADKQLMQSHVFESAAQIQACRLLTLSAARSMDRGEEAREMIGLIKVVGARMLHDVIDRAIQVHGARGLDQGTRPSISCTGTRGRHASTMGRTRCMCSPWHASCSTAIATGEAASSSRIWHECAIGKTSVNASRVRVCVTRVSV